MFCPRVMGNMIQLEKGNTLYDASAQFQNTKSSAEVSEISETEVSVASVISDYAEVKEKVKTITTKKERKNNS